MIFLLEIDSVCRRAFTFQLVCLFLFLIKDVDDGDQGMLKMEIKYMGKKEVRIGGKSMTFFCNQRERVNIVPRER